MISPRLPAAIVSALARVGPVDPEQLDRRVVVAAGQDVGLGDGRPRTARPAAFMLSTDRPSDCSICEAVKPVAAEKVVPGIDEVAVVLGEAQHRAVARASRASNRHSVVDARSQDAPASGGGKAMPRSFIAKGRSTP